MAPRKPAHLSPVPADGMTPPPADSPLPETVAAATEGTRRDVLVAQRARIAKAVDSEKTSPRDLAPLSRQLLLIDEEIRAIDATRTEGGIAGAARTPDDQWDSAAI